MLLKTCNILLRNMPVIRRWPLFRDGPFSEMRTLNKQVLKRLQALRNKWKRVNYRYMLLILGFNIARHSLIFVSIVKCV